MVGRGSATASPSLGQSASELDGLAGLHPPQRGVEAAVGDQLVVGARLDQPAPFEHVDAVGVADRSRGGGRSPAPCGPRPTVSSERWIAASVSLSTARGRLVEHQDASGRARMARAIESRWRWPPESFWPRSPTTVS